MQGRGDGFGRSIAAKHVTLQHTAVFIIGHKGKVPEHTTHTVDWSYRCDRPANGPMTICSAGEINK